MNIDILTVANTLEFDSMYIINPLMVKNKYLRELMFDYNEA